MKPANYGELSEYLTTNFECGEICELLDLHPEELMYYLRDPLEEKFDAVIEELFDNDEDLESEELET
jgi:hypothetical protein